MNDKAVKMPVIAGLTLQGLAVAGYLILIFVQKSFYPESLKVSELVIPFDFVLQCVVFLLYIIYMLAMQTTERSFGRTVSVIMIAVYTIIRIAVPYISTAGNVILARKGAEYIAASGVLASTATLVISPLVNIASVLVIVAVARYGIISSDQGLISIQERY
ncbi:MAG: hypothetical protein IJ600_03225 [Lachnospiraceae bacterium]|nr:hypothetical protein [Lachnospiraceae bacterium]